MVTTRGRRSVVTFAKTVSSVHTFDSQSLPASTCLDLAAASKLFPGCGHSKKNGPCKCKPCKPNICKRCCKECTPKLSVSNKEKKTKGGTFSCGHSKNNGQCCCPGKKDDDICQRCCKSCTPKTTKQLTKGPNKLRGAVFSCGVNHNKHGKCCCKSPKEGICKRCCDDCKKQNNKENVPPVEGNPGSEESIESKNASTPWVEKLSRSLRENTKKAIGDVCQQLIFTPSPPTKRLHPASERSTTNSLVATADSPFISTDSSFFSTNSLTVCSPVAIFDPDDADDAHPHANTPTNLLDTQSFRDIAHNLGLPLKYLPKTTDGIEGKPRVRSEIRRHGLKAVDRVLSSIESSYGQEIALEVQRHVAHQLHNRKLRADSVRVCSDVSTRSPTSAGSSTSTASTRDGPTNIQIFTSKLGDTMCSCTGSTCTAELCDTSPERFDLALGRNQYLSSRSPDDNNDALAFDLEVDPGDAPTPTSEDGSEKSYSFVDGFLYDDFATVKKQRDAFLFGALDFIDGQQRSSPIARACRALVVKALSRTEADNIRNKHTGHRVFGQKGRRKAQQDYRDAVNGKRLLSAPRTVERISESCIVFAVTCMLSTENVGLWSWGEKVVQIRTHGGQQKEKFRLPKIFLRKSVQDVWEDYVSRFGTDDDAPATKMGRSLFTTILGTIVSGESEMMTAVDYVTGMLLDDTINLLLEIITDWLGQNRKQQKRMEEMLEVTRNFLKNQYSMHCRKDDGIPTHNNYSALSKPTNYVTQYLSDDDLLSSDEEDDEDFDPLNGSGSSISSEEESSLDSFESDNGDAGSIGSGGDPLLDSCDTDRWSHSSSHLLDNDTFLCAKDLPDTNGECYACQYPFFCLQRLRENVAESYQRILDDFQDKEQKVTGGVPMQRSSPAAGKDEDKGISDDDNVRLSVDDSVNRFFVQAASWDCKLKDTLAAIDAIEDKFVLFMAHKHRVARQQDELYKVDRAMRQEALESGGNGTTMAIVGDFKMNFEPTGKGETTQEHYGKRGIPWHGFLGYYYRKVGDELEKVVIKVDQILEGDAQKNGAAVLSCLEIFLITVEEEFPFLCNAVLQTDNAACYHNKCLIFGIPFLNAVKGRKIRLSRFTHTETQDGKSLLDAHFARGTRQILKFIKTGAAIKNKRVGTPVELAEALAWNGGIQNSQVHHVKINRAHLAKFELAIHKISADALEYFSRANDIFYESEKSQSNVVESSSWSNMRFSILVYAYNGIGDGARFKADCGKELFELCNEGSDDDSTECRFEPDEEDDNTNNHSPELPDPEVNMGTSFDTSGDIERDLSALFQDHIKKWKTTKFEDSKKLNPPTDAKYQSNNLFSRIEVIGMSPFGSINGKVQTDKKTQAEDDNTVVEGGPVVDRSIGAARAALPRALHLVPVLAANNCIKIGAGNDDKLVEYLVAKGYQLNPLKFKTGWARRPLRGRLYGTSYMKEFYDEIEEWVVAGSKDKSDKMNARQMYLTLREKYGRYCIPLESEIRSTVDQILKKHDDNSTTTKKNKTKKKSKQEDLPSSLCGAYDKITEGMKQRVRQKGWQELKPAKAFDNLVKKHGLRLSKADYATLSKLCRDKYSAFKSARKSKHAKLQKKSLV